MGVYSKKRRDGTTAWYYDFMYNRVRYRGVGGTTKTQALRALEKARSNALEGDFGFVTRKRNPRFDDFVKNYLHRRKHLRSRRRDDLSARTLLKSFKNRVLSSIEPGDIEDYISRRKCEGVANATINRELACLKRMFSLAINLG